ncbi:MAG: hypothetical protein AAFY24_01835 [Pseudomonadota bacterium]
MKIEDEAFVEIEGYKIVRHSEKCASIIDPNGTVWERVSFGPRCPDTVENMLNVHRFGSPTLPEDAVERAPKYHEQVEMAIASLADRVGKLETAPKPEPAPKTNLQRAIDARYEEPEDAPEQPPEELAGFFDGRPHGMAAQELLQEINDLANLIHLELATDDDREKHRILSRHAPYLRSKAVEVV